MKTISIPGIIIMTLPLFVLGWIYMRWCGKKYEMAYATFRMTAQLLCIGFALVFLFENKQAWIGVLIVFVMMAVSAKIAIRPLENATWALWTVTLVSIGLPGTVLLFLVLLPVLQLESWYEPRYTIPLAGMTYSNAMNTVSLAAERFQKEREAGLEYEIARNNAFNAALIPQINTFFAVGLVSLPGMMTGQILSGVSPLIAVRYQIVIMCLIMAGGGLSSAMYLWLLRKVEH